MGWCKSSRTETWRMAGFRKISLSGGPAEANQLKNRVVAID